MTLTLPLFLALEGRLKFTVTIPSSPYENENLYSCGHVHTCTFSSQIQPRDVPPH